MKLVVLYLCTIMLILSCKEKNVHDLAKPLPVTKEYIISQVWGPRAPGLGIYIAFKKKKKYEIYLQGPGFLSCKGVYSISEKKVLLTPKTGEFAECEISNCKLFSAVDSFFSAEFLDCDNGDYYWNHNKKPKAGRVVNIDGFPSITLGAKEGKLTAKMRWRIGPGIKFPIVKFKRITDEGDTVPVKFLKKGTEVLILARTKQKSKVGKKMNYWYYIYPIPDFEWTQELDESFSGWTFSEWIK